MVRAEVIARITSQLASAPDELLEAVAWQLDAASQSLRLLTPRELALIEQSKEDFKAGRTSSSVESQKYVTEELSRRLALRTKS